MNVYDLTDVIVSSHPSPTTIRIAGDTIAAIGDLPSTPDVTRISLNGAYAYPGFRDAHCHLMSSAEAYLGLDGAAMKSIEDLIEKGRTCSGRGVYVKRFNDDAVAEHRLPTLDELDTIARDRPVIVMRRCGHVAVVNRYVLNRCPKLKMTHTNGCVVENDLDLLPSARTLFDRRDWLNAVNAVLDAMISSGLVALSANDFGRFAGPDDEALVNEALRAHPGLRYRSQYAVPLPLDEATFARLAASPDPKPAIKVFRDGSLGGRTAWLLAPYTDDPATCGDDTLGDDTHRQVFRLANRYGLQVLTHVIGDCALAHTLDCVAATTPRDNPLRHAIVHAQITSDALVRRLRQANLYAIVQPCFMTSDAVMAPQRLGRERYQSAYAFKAMADLGVPLAFSSDAPVEPFDPKETLTAALRGKGHGDGAFSFAEALTCMTQGAAAVDGDDSVRATLAVGQRADIALFSHALEHDLNNAVCLATVASGTLYHHHRDEIV